MRGIGLINDVKEIENIVVKNINGTPILVKHLATVHESSLPRLGQVGRMEEDDVVQGIVVMRKGENPGEVIAALKDKIKDIQQNALPEDVRIVSFYDRENLVDLAVKTVTHNLAEGILLVTFIVLIFMADWRTTVIVSIIIPLALLFAFICLRAMGMSANLLSMGAIDFGIIIDGAVVMVEGLFVALDRKAREVGMPAFNLMSKMGIIRHTAKDRAKAVFFSKLIITFCQSSSGLRLAEAGCRYLSLLLFEPVRLAPDRNPPDINGNVCLLTSWIRIVYALNDHKPLLGSLIFRERLVKR